jgi:hypothetical protein
VALCFVRRQSESCKLAVLSKDLAGMEPFATFGTPVDPIPVGNPVLLITPVVPASYLGCHNLLPVLYLT